MTLAKRELQGAEAELKIADAVKDLEELAQKAKESAVQLSEGNTGDMSKVIDYLTVDVMPCEERVKTVLADEVFNQVLSSKKRPAEKDPQQIARYEAYVERTIEAHHQLWQHIERIVWMFFKAAVENSLQKCSEALVSDGEHEFLDPVSEAKGRCLLDIRSIERALSVDDIATHTVFDEVVKQQKKLTSVMHRVGQDLAYFSSVGKTLRDICKCALINACAKLKQLADDEQWNAEDLKRMGNLDKKALATKLGISEVAQQHLATVSAEIAKVSKAAGKHFYSAVRVLVEQCTNSGPASVTADQTADVVKQILNIGAGADAKALHNFAAGFLQLMPQAAAVTASTSPIECVSVYDKLTSICKEWPSAPADDLELMGFHNRAVFDLVKTELQRVHAILSAFSDSAVKWLHERKRKVHRLIEDLSPDVEEEFRNKMKLRSHQIAKFQHDLKTFIGEATATSSVEMEGKDFAELPAIIEEARQVDAQCLYYISVYTALCFHRQPATWSKSAKGVNQRKVMQEVLRTLNTSPVHPIEKELNHRIVAEMRKEAGVDMPPADVPASGPVTVDKRKPAAVAQVLPETSGTSDNVAAAETSVTSDNVGPADVGSSANAQASGQVIDANNTSEPHAAVLVEQSEEEEWMQAAENALCVGKETPSVGENQVATPAATSRTEDNAAAVSTSTVVPATSEPQKRKLPHEFGDGKAATVFDQGSDGAAAPGQCAAAFDQDSMAAAASGEGAAAVHQSSLAAAASGQDYTVISDDEKQGLETRKKRARIKGIFREDTQQHPTSGEVQVRLAKFKFGK